MSYRLRIRLAAEADVAEAAQWYNERQLGLGEKFVREVDQAIVRILKNPLAFPVILRRHEVRRVLTKRFPYILEVYRMFAQMKLAFILSLLILTVSASRAVEIAFPEIAYWIPDGMKEADEQEVNLTGQGSIAECRIFYDVLAPGNRILTVVSYINTTKEDWVSIAQLEAYSKQSSAALIQNTQVGINKQFPGYAVTEAKIDLIKQQAIVDYSAREGGIDFKGTVLFSPLSNNTVFTIFVSINTPALSGTMQQILDSLRINPDYKLVR